MGALVEQSPHNGAAVMTKLLITALACASVLVHGVPLDGDSLDSAEFAVQNTQYPFRTEPDKTAPNNVSPLSDGRSYTQFASVENNRASGDPYVIKKIQASTNAPYPEEHDSCGPGGCVTKDVPGAPKLSVMAPKPDVPVVKYAPEGYVRIIPPNPLEEEPPLPPMPKDSNNLVILFKTENWVPFYAEVDADYTGRVLKNIVQDRTGLSVAFMKLSVAASNEEIDNDQLVKNMGLKHGSIVDVISTCAIPIPSNFKSFPPSDGINLQIQIPKYPPLELFADLDFTGAILKNIVMDRTGIVAQDMSLYLHETEILNSTKLMYAGVLEGDSLQVKLCDKYPQATEKVLKEAVSFPVVVQLVAPQKEFVAMVESEYTGAVLKQIVGLKAGFPGANMDLSIAGQLIDDAEVLSYYPVEKNDIIEAKLKNQEAPIPNGGEKDIPPQQWDTELVANVLPEAPEADDHFP